METKGSFNAPINAPIPLSQLVPHGDDDLDDESPRAYGIDHSLWRPSQYNALQFARRKFADGHSTVVVELPPGVGKSAIATALGRDSNVLVLVHTLNLLDQYRDRYGFSIIKGSQEYHCVLPKKVEEWRKKNAIPMASDCSFDSWQDCPDAEKCPYLVARDTAMSAKLMACTYRFAAMSPAIKQRTGILVLDEAHSAPDELLSMQELEINELTRQRYNLPPFPFQQQYGPGGKGDLLTPGAKSKLLGWVSVCQRYLSKIDEKWDPEFARGQKDACNKFKRVSEMLNMVEWFMEAGPATIDWWGALPPSRIKKDHKLPGIRLRPLSAAIVAQNLFQSKHGVLMMSATIGDPEPLIVEMGVSNYDFRAYPHPTPPDKRPIYDLGFPKMVWANYKDDPQLFVRQAQKIVQFINKWPRAWRGLILTSSYDKINQLRTWLTPPLGDRLANHTAATDMGLWMSENKPGSIAIQTMQGWGHGVDLHHDLARFLVMASVAFKNPSDRYQEVKSKIYGNGDFFWQSCYLPVVQACGRVSRSETDPNTGEFMLNVACLADGSAMTGSAQRFYPKYFTDAIVKPDWM